MNSPVGMSGSVLAYPHSILHNEVTAGEEAFRLVYLGCRGCKISSGEYLRLEEIHNLISPLRDTFKRNTLILK